MFSPIVVKEERHRKPQLLCNYSWPLPWGSINNTTLPHAPREAMQYGGALHQILWHTWHGHPYFGPPKGGKADLKDGFYKLGSSPSQCLRLAVTPPKYDHQPQLMAIALACTMGWVQSPPAFCAMSETVYDTTTWLSGILPVSSPLSSGQGSGQHGPPSSLSRALP